MKAKSAIEKGKRLEKFICQQIEDMGLGKSVRTPGSGSGGKKGDIFSGLDFLLECKNEAQTNFLPNIDQSRRDCEKGNFYKEKWCLITRDPRHPEFERIYATIDLWEFLKLLKRNAEPMVKEPDKDAMRKIDWARTKTKSVLKILEDNGNWTEKWEFKRLVEALKDLDKIF